MDIHSQICASTQYPCSNDVLLDRMTWLAGTMDLFIKATPSVKKLIAEETLKNEHLRHSTAQTIYVSEEIMKEVCEARDTMPDNVLLPQDVFVPNGMLVFEKPFSYFLTVTDGYKDDTGTGDMKTFNAREEWNLKAVQFNVINSVDYTTDDLNHYDGIEVRFFGHWKSVSNLETNEMMEYNPETDCAEITQLGITYKNATKELLQTLNANTSIATLEMLLKKAKGAPTSMFDATFFRFNHSTEEYDKTIGGMKKFLIALFRLTYSYLAQTHEEAPRHVIKRAKRANRKILENGYLTVLRLRRAEYENGGGTHSSPKYAFRVRGHWKRAYLRSTGLPVGDPNAYRYVYVSDYIKGKTANKEFRESTRVINITN